MKTAVEIEAQLRTKAEQDQSFRSHLIDDPRAAIKEETGLEVPETFAIHVLEETATDFYLVLPPEGGKISDRELATAGAGGYHGSLKGW